MFLQSLKLSRLFSVAMIMSGVCTLDSACAEEHPTHLGHYGAFDAYSYRETPTVTAYYITSHPTQSDPQNIKRSDPHFVATCRGPKIEPHFYLGFPVQKNAELVVDGQKFNLVGHEEGFWGENDAKDHAIVQALRQGATATVSATSTRGTKVVETYSLSGMAAALKAIESGCASNKGGATTQEVASTPATTAPSAPSTATAGGGKKAQTSPAQKVSTKTADKGGKTQASSKNTKTKAKNSPETKKDKSISKKSTNSKN